MLIGFTKVLCVLSIMLIFLINTAFTYEYKLFTPINEKKSQLQIITKKGNDLPVLLSIDKLILSKLLANKHLNIEFEIKNPANGIWKAILYKYEVFSPDAKVIINENDSQKEFDFRKGIVIYRGYIEGNTALKVNITFSENIVNGIISDNHSTWVIGNYNRNPEIAIFFNKDNVIAPPKTICNNTDLDISTEAYKVMMETVSGFAKKKQNILMNDKPLSIELALETDYITFQYFNNDENTLIAYITSMISVISQIYERDVNTSMTVKYLNIWKTKDPYPENPGDSRYLLRAAQNYWEENKKDVQRDVVMYLSARERNLGGEAASIGGVCMGINSFAYNTIKGYFKQLPAYSWDIVVTAHEFGHVFGSSHTHSCLWPSGPIDSCSASESGHCFDEVVPTEGTIMSYCINAGGSEIPVFHPLCSSVIRAFLERSDCIGSPSDAEKIYTLFGKVFCNGKSIPGIILKIEPINFDLWKGSMKPGGDSITTTDSAGNYSFGMLATGLYIVKPQKDYILLSKDDQKETGGIIIPSKNIIKDLNIAKVWAINGKVTFPEGIKVDSINYFLVKIDSLINKYPIEKYTFKSDTFSITAIEGNYVIIPNLTGYNFSPPYQHISLISKDINDVPFTAEAWKDCGMWGYTNFRKSIFINEPYPYASIRITDKATDSVFHNITTDHKGFFYLYDMPNKEFKVELCNYDTTKYIINGINSLIFDPYTKFSLQPFYFSLRDRKLPAFTDKYIFSSNTGIYNDIKGLGELIGIGRQFETNYKIGLPFNFLFGYNKYDCINIYRGYVTFGDSDPNTSTPISSNIIAGGVISIFSEYEYLFARDNYYGDTTKKTRLEKLTEGIAPNRVFTVQWSNIFTTNLFNQSSGYYNYQLKLYEKDHSIEFVYGECKLDSANSPLRLQIGLRGTENNDFNNRLIDSKNKWDQSAKGIKIDDFAVLTTINYPENGLTFRWVNNNLDLENTYEKHKDNLKVYPSVTSDDITLEFNWSNYSNVTIEVINSIGEVVSIVYKGYLDSGKYEFKFNTNQLSNGSYFCRNISSSGFLSSVGFIVIR